MHHQKAVRLRSSLHHQSVRWMDARIKWVPIVAFAQTLWLKHAIIAMAVFMWRAVSTVYGVIMLPTRDIFYLMIEIVVLFSEATAISVKL